MLDIVVYDLIRMRRMGLCFSEKIQLVLNYAKTRFQVKYCSTKAHSLATFSDISCENQDTEKKFLSRKLKVFFIPFKLFCKVSRNI